MSNTFTVNLQTPVPPIFVKGENLIAKKDLVDGRYYAGHCRNAGQAVWRADKQVFEYMRVKFAFKFVEEINHFEDFKGFDVFWPVAELKPEQVIDLIETKQNTTPIG